MPHQSRSRVPNALLLRQSAWASAVLLVGMVAASCGLLGGHASGVVVLLDYSATFAPYGAADEALLSQIQKAIGTMVSDRSLNQPVKIVWAAFGNVGLSPQQPCGPPRIFRQRLTGAGTNNKDEISDIKQLDAWFAACTTAIVTTSRQTQPFTDVSGALSFAASAVEDVRETKLIVLFSDLREDLPEGRSAPELKLRGSRVLLAWRPGLDDAKDPNLVARRAQEWSERLQKAGAGPICARPAAALTGADIEQCVSEVAK
jgi:hypothetical protein